MAARVGDSPIGEMAVVAALVSGRPVVLHRCPMVAGAVIDPGTTISAGVNAPAPSGARGALDRGLGARARLMLTPEAGLLGQGLRFVVNGCLSAGVYLLSTTLLALVAGMPFQLALAIGFCLMISVNFTLHRVFVWVNREGFALPVHHQFGRYMIFEGSQYGLTALSIGVLPRALELPTEIVYLLTALAFAGVSFMIFRTGVFHARESSAAD